MANPPKGEDAKNGPPPSPSPDNLGGFEMPREEYDLIMECARTGRPIPCAPIVIHAPIDISNVKKEPPGGTPPSPTPAEFMRDLLCRSRNPRLRVLCRRLVREVRKRAKELGL